MKFAKAINQPANSTQPDELEIKQGWKSNKVVVSIAFHTFNHERYVEQAMDSFLSQETTFAFEIIAHDDCSTDGTANILRRYKREYPSIITLIEQKTNQYSQGKRPPRTTYPLARGEFIAVCEGDDYWSSRTKLAAQVNALTRHPQVDLCIHSGWELNMTSGDSRPHCRHSSKEKIFGVSKVFNKASQFSPTASLVFKTSCLDRFPDWFFDDPELPYGDFFIEVISGKNGIVYLPTPMSTYRRGVEGSYTATERAIAAEKLTNKYVNIAAKTRRLAQLSWVTEQDIQVRIQKIATDFLKKLLASQKKAEFDFILKDSEYPWTPQGMLFRLASRYEPLFNWLARKKMNRR